MSQVASRYPQSILKRRVPRAPIWQRYWQRLPIVQQERIKSIAWSASFHLCVVAVLAAISLARPPRVSINLECVIDVTSAGDTLVMLAETDPMESIEELETLDELARPVPTPLEALGALEVALEPKDKAAELGAQAARELGAIVPPSSFAEMRDDDQRIAETDRRVAAAGGQLQGPVRISLIFSGDDDLDLHVQYQEVGRQAVVRGSVFPHHIFFQNPRTQHATLDVDASANRVVPEPCENVIFRTIPKLAKYVVAVHHYRPRGKIEPTPYVVVVNYGNKSKVFTGTIMPRDGLVKICEFNHSL